VLEGGGLLPVAAASDSGDPLLDLSQGQHREVQPVGRH
jgi:hypothetical protein